MPGRSRRKLDRTRYAVGYWWLEQTDRGRALGHGTASRARRFARGTATLRTRAADTLASPQQRRRAIAAVTGIVVAGVVLGATRLPGGEPSVERGAVTSGQASAQAGRLHGPGLTRPGIHLAVHPQESGDLEVVERVVLPEPTTVLPLSTPPSPRDADGREPRLVHLRVSADDSPIALAGSTVVEQERNLSLPRPATVIELHYRVENADERSVGAPADRATLAIRPAASGALDSQPAVVQVRGAVVHRLVCLEERQERRRCGVDAAGGWHTQPVTASRSSVLALVDLPSA